MFKTVVLTNGVHLRRCPGLNARNDRQGFTVGWRLTIYRFGAEKRNPGASETASDLEGVWLTGINARWHKDVTGKPQGLSTSMMCFVLSEHAQAALVHGNSHSITAGCTA